MEKRTPDIAVVLLLLALLAAVISIGAVNSAPKFNYDLGFTSITEGDNGTLVGTLNATDSDGDNVTYSITDTPERYLSENPYKNAKLYLEVDPVTGEVTIIHPVDRESTGSQIKATWVLADQSSTTTFPPTTLMVADINDEIPQIVDLPNRLESSLKENAKPGDEVTTFKVEDRDTGGTNGQVDVVIVGHDEDTSCEDNPFKVQETVPDSKQFKIILDGSLDYSAESEYTVCLEATDRGDIPLSSRDRVIIPIEDVQNLGPVFLNEPYSTELPEDVKMGTSVVQVRAQDGDRGVPAPNKVFYSLTSEEFEIDSDTGVITVAGVIDRENMEENPYRLTVNATELDSMQPLSQRTEATTVFVRILDVDDEIPEFDETSKTVQLLENLPPGTPLNLGVTVFDGDEGSTGFELEIEQPHDAFRLQETDTLGSTLNVDVRVDNSEYLDFEVYKQLNFTVFVNGYRNASRLDVTVNIMNVNDHNPEFAEESYTADFPENVETGYVILTVFATDGDSEDVTYAINPEIPYFTINKTTGEISVPTDVTFDAETNTDYLFTVEATDGERVAQTIVTLTCLDVNDEVPTFQKHQSEVFESEFNFNSSDPPASIFTFQAYDGDITNPNNIFLFSIAGGDDRGTFYIDSTTGDLYFNSSVDYDGPGGDKEYDLIIHAQDTGHPPLVGNTTLRVAIEDVNDNAPEFSQDIYYFTVREDATDQEVVATVNATDLDSGLLGRVSYAIESGGQGIFYMLSDGSIRVGGSLDKERGPVDGYLLEITARDGGAPPLVGACQVNITLIDVNDESPVFQGGPYGASVLENAAKGTEVAIFTATDADEDSALRYSIGEVMAFDESSLVIPGDFSGIFLYSEGGGVLTVDGPLDRETVETYVMNLTVRDANASSEQRDTAIATVTISDVNDEAPVFDTPPPSLAVIEESPVGMVITTEIRATDSDKGTNSRVLYSLDDDAGGRVTIDEEEGTLTIANRIDHEEVHSLTITVRAEDQGTPSLGSTQDLTIAVIDINDNPPVFDQVEYDTDVPENTPSGSLVTSVIATDDDEGEEFAGIEYFIQGGNTGGWFEVNRSNGEITVKTPPDREATDTVFLVVAALGSGGFQASTLVTITILDENDNRPEFIKFEEFVKTSVSIDVGDVITTVVAADPDEGAAGTVLYRTLDGNGTGVFDIDELSGEVCSNMSLEDRPGTYELLIEAADNGTPEPSPGYDSRLMVISVDDITSTPPVFVVPRDGQVYNMSEGYNQTDTPILVASAYDEDYGEEGEVAYRLVETAGNDDWTKFTVDNITGELFYTAEPPDWQYNPQFNLLLEVYNHLTDLQLWDRVNFVIEVIDEDNHDPEFVNPETGEPLGPVEMEVVENTGSNTYIGSVSADDKDQDADIYYYIVEGNENGYFILDKDTGDISSTDNLDSDVGATYELVVKATDDENYIPSDKEIRGRRASMSASNETDPSLLVVVIEVLDLNDNPPEFPEDLYVAGVVYTAEYDVLVTRVEATDRDSDEENIKMEYSITKQRRLTLDKEPISDDEGFAIDPENGDIRLKASFHSIRNGIYYELTIRVVDPSKPEYSHETELVIYVIITSQQLKVHTLVSAEATRASKEDFESELAGTLGKFDGGEYDVVFDGFSSYTGTVENDVRANETESLFHVVNVTTSDVYVVSPIDVLYILDHSPNDVDKYTSEFSVKTIYVADYTPPEPIVTPPQLALIVVTGLLFVILVLIIMACLFDQNRREKDLAGYGIDLNPPSDSSTNSGIDNDAYEDIDSDAAEEKMDFDPEDDVDEYEYLGDVGAGEDNTPELQNLVLSYATIDGTTDEAGEGGFGEISDI